MMLSWTLDPFLYPASPVAKVQGQQRQDGEIERVDDPPESEEPKRKRVVDLLIGKMLRDNQVQDRAGGQRDEYRGGMQKKQGIEPRGDEDPQSEGQQGQGSNAGTIDTIRVHGAEVAPKQFVGHEKIADAAFSPAVLLDKELGIFLRRIGPAVRVRIHIGVIAQKKSVVSNVAVFALNYFYAKPVTGENLGLDLLKQTTPNREQVATHAGHRLRPVLIGFP